LCSDDDEAAGRQIGNEEGVDVLNDTDVDDVVDSVDTGRTLLTFETVFYIKSI
jgi:hypothetical protein